MSEQRVKYEQLINGFQFSPSTFTIDPQMVSLYLKATEDENAVYENTVVPSMAVAALAMAAMAEKFDLLPGTLHVSQQLIFLKPVNIDSTLKSYIWINRKVARGKFHMLNLGLKVVNENAEPVVIGEIGFVLPIP